MTSAEAWYHEIASAITPDHIDRIIAFYRNWKGQDHISLKFRYLKGFFLNQHKERGEWHLLHQLANKRRIPNDKLVSTLNNHIIDEGFIPIRLFHSVSEWLAPNEVFQKPHVQNWLIKPGFLPLEDDTSLTQSITTAQNLYSILNDGQIVYSGNKSIHIWYPLSFDSSEIDFSSPMKIINADRKKRRDVFKKLHQQFPNLDKRIANDPWRVVPIINSLNATTGRIVTALDGDQLTVTSADLLMNSTKLESWDTISRQ